MASEKDLELLDQYIGNRLTPQEKTSFEQKLESDASLKNEFQFQQKIVSGIRNARAGELKSMLNNIPVSSIPTNGTSVLVKVGLSVVVAGLVGTGAYFFLRNDETVETQEPIAAEVIIEEERSAEVAEPQTESADQDILVPESAEAATPVEEKQNPKPAETSQATQDIEQKQTKPSVLDVYEPSDELESANQSAIEGSIKANAETTSSIVVETLTDKKYSFHYQFKDQKLFLYGTFEKNLYEILEFFSDNKRTMFLFYRDNYYLLNEDGEKVKPLDPIGDANLLKKLKDFRGN